MSSDSRWTGGLANREWQRGNKVEQPADTDYIVLQVRRYLADCRRFDLTPSEGMAVKVVFGPDALVRAAYQQQTRRTAEAHAAQAGDDGG